ncbi:MAG TPA: hypothetical protein VF993_08670, partial [Myxococcales bacterium]
MKFRKRAFIAALLAFGAAFAGQLALRTLLGNKTLFSPDAVLAISFGAEALAFMVAGFFVSFLARGFGGREMGAAAALLAPAAFVVLRQMKPPSFSYDRFFASTEELIVWGALSGVGAWLLGMWGASGGVLLGAAGTPDLRFGYEVGIARTHLRLNRHTAVLLIALALVPPGLLFAAGIAASFQYKRGAQTSAMGIIVAAAAVV